MICKKEVSFYLETYKSVSLNVIYDSFQGTITIPVGCNALRYYDTNGDSLSYFKMEYPEIVDIYRGSEIQKLRDHLSEIHSSFGERGSIFLQPVFSEPKDFFCFVVMVRRKATEDEIACFKEAP